jgi:predicted nucleic acid-binding protein
LTATCYDVETYAFPSSEKYFVDSSVWLAIYGPTVPKDRRATIYSDAWKRLRTNNAAVFIDVLVMSELVNRWSRLEWGQLPEGRPDFKTFRTSPQFVPIAQHAANELRRILKNVKRTGTPFANTDIEVLLTQFASGAHDINDQLIAEKCRLDGLVLVSDDGDMAKYDLQLVTGNRKVLASQRAARPSN